MIDDRKTFKLFKRTILKYIGFYFFFKVALSSQFQDKKFQCNTSKISHFMKKQKMKLSVFVFSYAKYSFAGAFCQAKTLKLGTSDCQ